MARSCGLVPVILVLVLTVTGTQAKCEEEELKALKQCIVVYDTKFFNIFRTKTGTCDPDLISKEACEYFAAIVNCTNALDISNTTCRPFAVEQLNKKIAVPCKIRDFQKKCKDAPVINEGDAGGGTSGAGISLGMLGAVTFVSLIAHM